MTATTEQSNEPKSNLLAIREKLLSSNVVSTFMENLPQAMGKHGEIVAKRFATMVYAYIATKPELQICTIKSIIRSASESASMGLDIDKRGLAYLVPRKNHGIWEAQFQIGYLGLMELAYRSNKVKCINAHCIYESEKDAVKISRVNGRYKVEHPFSYETPKGNVIATYATADLQGFGSQTMVLRVDEVEKLRHRSQAPNSPAWQNDYEAMSKKTVIRQLAKFLPKSVAPEFSQAAAADEAKEFGEMQVETEAFIEADLGSEPVDATFENGGGEKPEAKQKAKRGSRSRKSNKQTEVPKFQYVCHKPGCGIGFDEPKMVGPEKSTPTCPACGSLQVGVNPELAPAMEE